MFMIPISMVNLITILEFIGLRDLCWSMLHLWATSKQESEIDILDLEEKTKAKFGYQLDWDSLLAIAKQLEQVNECTIVGVNPTESLPNRSLSLEDLRKICHVVIEAVDSSYWEVFLKDEVLSKRLVEKFS
ncbi:MAG: hypothetical protein HC921_15715 [Synechococcaceae cyanobacterium SM2_3_1]|nr:hypothetical protein [Synechococcaceae cyanobacterium SM2_3_1]